MRIIFLAVFVFGTFFSCDKVKDEDFIGRSQPEIPDPLNFDANNDGITDISFSYHWGIWDGAGVSGSFISLSIDPMKKNKILAKKRSGDGYELILFNKFNDTIFSPVSQPHEWLNRASTPLNISSISGNIWPTEWSVENERVTNPYYLGIKIEENDNSQIGWLKLKINSRSGKIEILDYELTLEDHVVIDR